MLLLNQWNLEKDWPTPTGGTLTSQYDTCVTKVLQNVKKLKRLSYPMQRKRAAHWRPFCVKKDERLTQFVYTGPIPIPQIITVEIMTTTANTKPTVRTELA